MQTVRTLLSMMVVAALSVAVAQAQDTGAAAGTREIPRPQDIDPAVNTSAPARETPRPEDLEPAVDTSSAAQVAAAAASKPADNRPAAPGRTASGGKALDRIQLDTTQITGNRELPKVLYIVPWKRSDLGDLVGKPVNSLLDEVLTPVDRDVFRRENRYYRALTPGAAENDALSAFDTKAHTPVRSPVPTNSAPAAGSPGSATQPGTTGGSAARPPGDEK